MYGGPDGTCVDTQQFQATTGRPCPRVDIDTSLALEAELLGFLVHDDLKRLAGSFVESVVEFYELTPEENVDLLRRVRATLSHPDVSLRLHPQPEERPRQ